MGLESESTMNRDAFIARFDLCDNLGDYANPVATDISTVGTKCKKNMKWTWSSGRSGKTEMFGYSAVSPDKSFIIAAGTRQGSSNLEAPRILHNDGWLRLMPIQVGCHYSYSINQTV